MTEEKQVQEIRIVLGDQPDVVFAGRELRTISTHTYRGPTQNRWDEYTLYQTASGKYIVRHKYFTQWEGEMGWQTATVYETEETLLAAAAEQPLMVRLLKEAGLDVSQRIE